ncbi:hypothetical protein [Nocardioides bruguierae]|uniref:hypothetical protein n=1 Tax=Nocardioides bruguierae TaxID=2945102 RepID=UPI00202187FB|nr:hypothetical protein [Nocardioides bruguierae]MCL8027568.1 hypothetical protein [Nocardioides bruguierae]
MRDGGELVVDERRALRREVHRPAGDEPGLEPRQGVVDLASIGHAHPAVVVELEPTRHRRPGPGEPVAQLHDVADEGSAGVGGHPEGRGPLEDGRLGHQRRSRPTEIQGPVTVQEGRGVPRVGGGVREADDRLLRVGLDPRDRGLGDLHVGQVLGTPGRADARQEGSGGVATGAVPHVVRLPCHA